jgi:hypothetical protein
MCELAGVSRASFYRYWTRQEPAAAETELRAAVQRLALGNRKQGKQEDMIPIPPHIGGWPTQTPGRPVLAC